MNYDDELKRLSGLVGGRNRRLLTIAIKGRRAGKTEKEMISEIIAAGGEPELSEKEVERAVEKAMKIPLSEYRTRSVVGHSRGRGRKTGFSRRSAASTAGERPKATGYSFVREMIAKGGGAATSRELKELSPTPVPKLPWVQAVNFCMMLEEPDSMLYFIGTPEMKRTRDQLYNLDEFEVKLIDEEKVPFTHILPNDLTGKPVLNEKGEESYAREGCVAHARYTVIEFDNMPLAEQAAFWKGVILSDLLPLRALVYSGGKSIHGLLRLDDEKGFKEQWKTLERNLASDPESKYRCDLSFRSPVQMMRLPGAIRPETDRHQALLYLD